MKKRCNIYIEEENVKFLHDNNKNISQLTDKMLAKYVELMRMSENELVVEMNRLRNEIVDKQTELKMMEERLIELSVGDD